VPEGESGKHEPGEAWKPGTGLVFLAVLGALMLLPGACGLIFTAFALGNVNDPYTQVVFIFSLPSIVVGLLGLWLLIWSVKRYRQRLG